MLSRFSHLHWQAGSSPLASPGKPPHTLLLCLDGCTYILQKLCLPCALSLAPTGWCILLKQGYKARRRKKKNFPGGPAVETLPVNAEDMGFISGRGTIPHASGQQSHRAAPSDQEAATIEALRALSLCSTSKEAITMRRLHIAARE